MQCESVITVAKPHGIPEVVLTPCIGRPPGVPRSYYYMDGLGGAHKYGVHNPKNADNIIRGIEGRIFRVEGPTGPILPPKPTRGAWKKLEKYADCLATPLCGAVRMSMDEFVEQCPNRNRKRYEQARSEYIQKGMTEVDAVVGTFVKYEKINFADKPDPAPRVIQPRSFKYNLRLGMFTRVIESQLYHTLDNLWGGELSDERTVIKGMGVLDAGRVLRYKWDAFGKNAVAVEVDASRFDQHVSRDALIWEHSVYLKVFGNHPELRWLLRQQLQNRGRVFIDDTKITYVTDGCRMSGDMNTGLGNTMIMCMLLYVYCLEHGIEAKLANNGDDAVLFMDRRSLPKLRNMAQWFLGYGFNLKIENPKHVFEQIEFCQSHPVLTSVGWKMVRDLKCLSKDLLCLGCKTENEAMAWLGDVGRCGLSLFADVPVLGAFYANFVKFGGKQKRPTRLFMDSGMYRSSRVVTACGVIDDVCRASFFFATGIGPDEQIAIENRMAALKLGRWDTLRGECIFQ